MLVSSTEVQNNFGKYLDLAAQEEIIVTRNGRAVAMLTAVKDPAADRSAHSIAAERSENYWTRGKKATYEEFLALREHAEERYEYIDGEIYLLASPRIAHQFTLMELANIFYNWFQGKKCRPFVAPFDIELRRGTKNMNMVQPDLMVICDLEEGVNEEDEYKGVPTLVVEILSPSTRHRDLIKKFDLYMSCGVQEYWIVNPINKEVAVYKFENREIAASITYKNEETIRSYVFEGLSAELQRLFR